MAVSFDDIPDGAYSEAVMALFGNQALVEKADCFNFVCPVCGDMNFPNKKKAYVYKDTWRYLCYKCGESRPFLSYLKENSPENYSRLIFYAFDKSKNPSNGTRKSFTRKKPVEGLPFMDGELVSIVDNHPTARAGLEICKRRRIRRDVYENWFVCIEGEEFTARTPDGAPILNSATGRPYGNEYKNRIIIPFYRYGGSWSQFDARAIDPNNELRYRNFEGAKRTAYNIDFVNFKKPFYILEGTIDSTFVKNSIAIGGIAHLNEVIAENPDIMKYKENCTIIWDNDDPGRKAMVESTARGFRWFDWDGIATKDINGAVTDTNVFHLTKGGYIDPDEIAARSRLPGTAGVLFMLKYGNLEKQEFKAKMQARKNAAAAMENGRKLDIVI